MRRNTGLVYGIFISVGVIFLLLASLLSSQGFALPSDISLNIGMIVLSLALIDFLWKIVGGDPLSEEISQLRSLNTLSQAAAKTGLAGVIGKSENTEREYIFNLYNNAQRSVDISGWTLKMLADNDAWRKTMASKAEKGITVRILLYDPQNNALNYIMNDDPQNTSIAAVKEEMKFTWNKFQQIKASLSEDARKRFMVKRLKEEIMYYSVRRIDEIMYVIPYSFELSTSDSPVYWIHGADKPLFEAYMREFDCLFARASET